MEIELKIERLPNCAALPEYKTEGASGMDLSAAICVPVTLKPLERVLIPTGLKIELPIGIEAQIRPRSGLSIKNGITLINCVGTIDADYRGEICVGLVNLSNEEFTIQRGDRIAQMVICPVILPQIKIVETLTQSARGTGGFGSTGV